MNKLSKKEIIDIINDILDVKNHTEAEIDQLIKKLEDGVTDPEITDYIYFDELTPEEIADKALAYQPICL